MVQHVWKKSVVAAALVLMGASGAVLLQGTHVHAQQTPQPSATVVRGLPDFTDLVAGGAVGGEHPHAGKSPPERRGQWRS